MSNKLFFPYRQPHPSPQKTGVMLILLVRRGKLSLIPINFIMHIFSLLPLSMALNHQLFMTFYLCVTWVSKQFIVMVQSLSCGFFFFQLLVLNLFVMIIFYCVFHSGGLWHWMMKNLKHHPKFGLFLFRYQEHLSLDVSLPSWSYIT